MSEPLLTTFEVLGSSASLSAVDVLLAALDSASPRFRELAVTALLRRSSSRGHIEVIRRLETLGSEAQQAVERSMLQIAAAIRQSIQHGDDELRRNAIELVRRTESYDLIPPLLDVLIAGKRALDAATVLAELVNRLYEHLHASPDAARPLRNVSQVRQKVLLSLDQAIVAAPQPEQLTMVIESILILSEIDTPAARRVLGQAGPACREVALRTLGTSSHPGVMQLLVDAMAGAYPSPKMLELFETREDVEWVSFLLRWFPTRLNQQQQKNFRQLKSVAWLSDPLLLNLLPPPLHAPLVDFVAATGLPYDDKLNVQEWLLRNGNPQGRLAAAHALSSLDEESIQDILFDGLNSEDPEVEAWAVGQLRSHGVPQAFSLLIGRLDSPIPAVRDAARAELSSFSLDRLLGLFEQLDPGVCRSAGRLIRKIEPDCLKKLVAELNSPVRRRRIRAARGAQALGLHADLVPTLLAMLDDTDPMVRRSTLEVLSDVRTAEAVEGICRHLEDESPRVRETARKILAEFQAGESPALAR